MPVMSCMPGFFSTFLLELGQDCNYEEQAAAADSISVREGPHELSGGVQICVYKYYFI